MINAYINIIGWCFAAVVWMVIMIGLMAGLSFCIGWYSKKIFSELNRTYHIRVIAYWLDRLERFGVREFEKAEQHDKNIKAVKGGEFKEQQ